MLYEWHEIQRSWLNPVSRWAEIGAQIYSHPVSPWAYGPLSRRLAASFELLHRLGKHYEKPQWEIETTRVDGKEVAVHIETDIDKPFCKLTHFKRALSPARQAKDPRVLIFAPLSGHHATLLRDTVRTMMPHHDVWITEWTDARLVPLSAGPFSLDHYIDYAREFIRHLGPDVHLISVCQPTVPVAAAVSLMSSAKEKNLPKSMTMMGGPIDTRVGSTQVNALAKRRSLSWFKNNVIFSVPSQYPGYLRKVYPGFLQHAGFVAMNPDKHAQSHYDYYLHLIKGDEDDAETHRKFYDEYNAVLDLPAEYYLRTIEVVFKEHLLPRGLWQVHGDLVRPQDIKSVALMTVEGELDDISGPGQTQAIHQLCTGIPKSRQEDFVVPQAGHYGIFSGRRWREIVYPKVRSFISRFN